jgi:4-amino-4-deoxy-L-arabinose transferase-like glycosyltransferase
MTTNRYRLSAQNAFPLAALVFLAALGIRLVGAGDGSIHIDEYYTILAARSYAVEGVPRIWDGVYPRALGFTAIVAASLSVFGDSLLAARLPSLLAGSLLVALAFLWLRREAGVTAGWLVALLLALSASAIDIAQFSRFYALHATLFFICAVAVYGLVTPGDKPRTPALLAAAAVALASAAGALHLQETTGIGLLAIAVWTLPALALRRDVRARVRGQLVPAWVLAGVVVLFALGLALFTGLADRLADVYARYRWTALWNEGHRDNSFFYLRQLAHALPVLFYLFPAAALVALARAPRVTSFCLVVSTVALLLHSFAGMKDMRYIHYLWPLLLAPWAIAGAALVGPLRQAAGLAWSHARAAWSASSVAAGTAGKQASSPLLRIATGGALALTVAAVLIGNREYRPLRTLPLAVAAELGVGEAAHASQARALAREQSLAALREVVDAGGYLATSSELHALWYLGRFDLVVHTSRLHDFAPGQEFARDPRTGGLVISEADSLARVMSCQPSGTLLVWGGDWGRADALKPEVADLAEATMREAALPAGLHVRAFQWRSDPAVKTPCAPPLKHERAAPLAQRPERGL